MPKAKTKSRAKSQPAELDSVYVLKLVLYVIIGSQWLHFVSVSGNDLPIPLGLLIGLGFAAHDHFKIDRKVEYAVLIVATLVGYWAQVGFFVH